MREAGKLDRDRLVAVLVVVGAHAAFCWLLLRAAAVPPLPGAGNDALQVRWIDPPEREAAAKTTRAPTPRSPAPRRVEPRRPQPPSGAPMHDAPESDAPMSAVFIEQGNRFAHDLVQGEAAAGADPFADRRAPLPGRAGGAFRMREPRSLQRTLRRVGQLVGGPGYSTDPCPRIRDNIASLANGEGAERELLAEELRRKNALCD
jgi:hypothetical protein